MDCHRNRREEAINRFLLCAEVNAIFRSTKITFKSQEATRKTRPIFEIVNDNGKLMQINSREANIALSICRFRFFNLFVVVKTKLVFIQNFTICFKCFFRCDLPFVFIRNQFS